MAFFFYLKDKVCYLRATSTGKRLEKENPNGKLHFLLAFKTPKTCNVNKYTAKVGCKALAS